MPYDIELSDAAMDTLERLPAELISIVDEELRKLGDAPAKLSRPSVCPPDPPDYQKYEFWAGKRHFVRVFFKYCTNEQALWVGVLGYIEYGNL